MIPQYSPKFPIGVAGWVVPAIWILSIFMVGRAHPTCCTKITRDHFVFSSPFHSSTRVEKISGFYFVTFSSVYAQKLPRCKAEQGFKRGIFCSILSAEAAATCLRATHRQATKQMGIFQRKLIPHIHKLQIYVNILPLKHLYNLL